MDDSVPYLDIILLAMLAGFIALQLRRVLGRRTGAERPPPARDPFEPVARDDNVVPLPQRAPRDGDVRPPPPASGPAAGLTQIQVADRGFELDGFIAGARMAYEEIVKAVSAGDLDSVRSFVSPDVVRDFQRAIDQRKADGLVTDSAIAAILKSEVADARMTGRTAEITIAFTSELISVTRNASGQVVDGHPTAGREVTDIWTFARDTRSRDPNWQLIRTAAPD
ncbi:Tim44/TimA family putative adaptor protein [Zavarzinia sp. CC-PAN008]|uniref:Tim44/TimA family putative adaptor protein n=1 Tax=Zavarzinia sp. CC-PAN008 TaxID=3243332 RepID=UPI003F74AD0F